ncbi:hypothetical protein [Streptomyces sp. NPDC056188]|uniref:hypothetical protein n=1 Tax=Streptomyces sp. NPDC056188 TaxID=3345740 RepID=UPI0035D9EB0B
MAKFRNVLRLLGENGQQELLVLDDLVGVDRRRGGRGGSGRSGGRDRTGIGPPAAREIGEHSAQYVRRTQRSLDLALDGVGPSRLVETDRVLGDGAVDRPLQHHAAVHRGVLGARTRLDQGVGVCRGQPSYVQASLVDRVGHP